MRTSNEEWFIVDYHQHDGRNDHCRDGNVCHRVAARVARPWITWRRTRRRSRHGWRRVVDERSELVDTEVVVVMVDVAVLHCWWQVTVQWMITVPLILGLFRRVLWRCTTRLHPGFASQSDKTTYLHSTASVTKLLVWFPREEAEVISCLWWGRQQQAAGEVYSTAHNAKCFSLLQSQDFGKERSNVWWTV